MTEKRSTITRRQFLQFGVLAGTGLVVGGGCSGFREAAVRFVPKILAPVQTSGGILGGTLGPGSVEKFVMPLIRPPAMPGKLGKHSDQYRIAVRQFLQQVLSPPHPKTTVWGYGSANHLGTVEEGGTFSYPGFTVEATWNKTVEVQWLNQLVDAEGKALPHLLSVDPTLHWANPAGAPSERDTHSDHSRTPGPYLGPVPFVTHVHGAHTTEDSDGYPEAWYLPDAKDIPAGYARTGIFYDYFGAKYGHKWSPGTATYIYPNDQRATALWYHDHTMGITRLNVYTGPAGFYLIRGGPDDQVEGVLPGPAPDVGDGPFGTCYEIPIVVQDRSFNADGSLFYPGARAFFDGFTGPYAPDANVPPIWNPVFFGNVMVVNGRSWPYLEIEQRRYRFRLLNGCNARFLILKLDRQMPLWQIGTDGGFLDAPVNINERAGGHIALGPAERADVIVDFTSVPVGTEIILLNLGPDGPFRGYNSDGTLSDGRGGALDPADPASTGQVMAFRVVASSSADRSTPPEHLGLPEIARLDPAGLTPRVLSLHQEYHESTGVPAAALLGVGMGQPRHFSDPITENPALGATEVWEIDNITEHAHPVHLHQVMFQVLGRGMDGTQPTELWEKGWKDTVMAYPGEKTRIIARFDLPGHYVWHCHMLEHEDNEMMRPFHVGSIPPDGPIQ